MKTKKLMICLILIAVCIPTFTMGNAVSQDLPAYSGTDGSHIQTRTKSESVNKYALLVGSSGGNLDYTDDDVYDMEDVLINNCHFDPQNIRVLIDANATKTDIQNNITWIASNAQPNDTVLFLFSGHGGQDYVSVYGSTISDNELDLWFSDINSTNVVIIIDSCYAASMIEKSKTYYKNETKNFSYPPGVKNENSEKVSSLKGLGQDGRIVLVACAESQYSWEDDELNNGVFTYYLTEGLKSALVDTNGNGWVSAEEAFYYAKSRTYEFNNSENPAGGQDPQIYDGIEGEVDVSFPEDLVINNTGIYSDQSIILKRNLTITGNGSLVFNNVTLMMNSSFNGEYHIEVQSGGKLYIYNSNITSANNYHYLFWVRNNSKFEMKDSELHKCGYEMLGGNYSYTGLWINTDNITLCNNIFSENYAGLCFYRSENDGIINNTISNNIQHDICLENSTLYVFNTTFNKTKVFIKSNSSLTVSWYLNVNVLYQNNTPVKNASVVVGNVFMVEVFNGSTDENGWIKNIVTQEYFQKKMVEGEFQISLKIYQTPYLVSASKNGYYGSATVEMNQNREITIYLKDVALPNADAGDDKTINEDREIELNAGLSSDNIGIVNYTWWFVDQGKQITLYGNTIKYNFIQPGFYIVILNVSDKAGNHDTDIINIAVKDVTKPVIENVSTQIASYMNCKVECMVYDNVGVETVEISMDNHSWKKCVKEGNKYAGEIGLKSRNNTVYVRVTDSSGNVNITSISVFVKVHENPIPDFIYEAVALVIILIFCMCLTIILEHKPKRKRKL